VVFHGRTCPELTESETDCAAAGIVTGLRQLKTKRGDRMAAFSLEDETTKVEAVIFPEAFAKYGSLAVDDAMVLVRGKYDRGEESSRLVVSEMTPLHLVRERAVREVEIRLSRGLEPTAMRALATVLDRHQGDRRVSVVIDVDGPAHLRVRAGTARRIRPSDGFVRDVEALCGNGTVVLK
jgi:DNA polymerase-3 subunit alpha